MPIITKSDLVTRFGEQELIELTDRDNHQEIEDVVLTRAITDAHSLAMSYLLPAGLGNATPSSALIHNVCDIARYYLHEDSVTEVVDDRYKQALAWLKMVMDNPRMIAEPEANTSNQQSVTQIAMQRG